MSNSERLPSYRWFANEFGNRFITDTYSIVSESDGFEKTFDGSLKERREESSDLSNWDSWQSGVSPGSVTAQFLELLWAMHRDDFWSWRLDDAE